MQQFDGAKFAHLIRQLTMKTLLTALALSLSVCAPAQNYSDIHALLDMDLRTEKDAIVMAALDLDTAQRTLFMPIYDAYMVALKAHWAKRASLIDDYAQARETLDDATAASFMKRLTALEYEFINIRDSHAKQVTKVLPKTIAARWVLLERRLNQLFELQVANESLQVPTQR
jgi:hypothetical protein